MIKRVICILSVLMLISLNLTSSFVFADDTYGENLWLNSTFDDSFNGYFYHSSTFNGGTAEIVDGYSGHNGVNLSRENYSGYSRCWVYTVKPSISTYKSGDIFILSAWVRVDNQLTANLNGFFPNSVVMVRGSAGDTPQIIIPNTAKVGEWVYYTNTFIASSDGKFDNCFVILGANGAITVSNIKLEKGSKATSWTPAPEDRTYISSLLISMLSLLKDSIISVLPIVIPIAGIIVIAIIALKLFKKYSISH